jgi:hypothetical protein
MADKERQVTIEAQMKHEADIKALTDKMKGSASAINRNARNELFGTAADNIFGAIIGDPTSFFHNKASVVGGLISGMQPIAAYGKNAQSFQFQNAYKAITGGMFTASDFNAKNFMNKNSIPSIAQQALLMGDYGEATKFLQQQKNVDGTVLSDIDIKKLIGSTPKDYASMSSSARARYAQTQFGEAAMNLGGSLVGNFLGSDLLHGDPNTVSQLSGIGGAIMPLIATGLGAWAGPIGMVVGGLLGGLFSHRHSQPDPAEEAHRRKVEDLLSRMDRSLRPVADYYSSIKGVALYGQSSRYLSGRYNSGLGKQLSFGGRG